MPQPDKHVPKHVAKHRQPSSRAASRTAVRTLLVLSSLAVVGTGAAVAAGTVSLSPAQDNAVAAAEVAAPTPGSTTPTAQARQATPETAQSPGAEATVDGAAQAPEAAKAKTAAGADRGTVVSRSDRRGVADPQKEAALSLGSGNAMTRSEDMSDEDPRTIAQALLPEFGFSSSQFGCLDSLWTRESGWSVTADNPSSSAYGIPQALPGSKMSSAGSDWATNPVTQIRWGLGYIEDRYGSPCGAWAHSESSGFY